jgi:hypothetical protein
MTPFICRAIFVTSIAFSALSHAQAEDAKANFV